MPPRKKIRSDAQEYQTKTLNDSHRLSAGVSRGAFDGTEGFDGELNADGKAKDETAAAGRKTAIDEAEKRDAARCAAGVAHRRVSHLQEPPRPQLDKPLLAAVFDAIDTTLGKEHWNNGHAPCRKKCFVDILREVACPRADSHMRVAGAVTEYIKKAQSAAAEGAAAALNDSDDPAVALDFLTHITRHAHGEGPESNTAIWERKSHLSRAFVVIARKAAPYDESAEVFIRPVLNLMVKQIHGTDTYLLSHSDELLQTLGLDETLNFVRGESISLKKYKKFRKFSSGQGFSHFFPSAPILEAALHRTQQMMLKATGVTACCDNDDVQHARLPLKSALLFQLLLFSMKLPKKTATGYDDQQFAEDKELFDTWLDATGIDDQFTFMDALENARWDLVNWPLVVKRLNNADLLMKCTIDGTPLGGTSCELGTMSLPQLLAPGSMFSAIPWLVGLARNGVKSEIPENLELFLSGLDEELDELRKGIPIPGSSTCLKTSIKFVPDLSGFWALDGRKSTPAHHEDWCPIYGCVKCRHKNPKDKILGGFFISELCWDLLHAYLRIADECVRHLFQFAKGCNRVRNLVRVLRSFGANVKNADQKTSEEDFSARLKGGTGGACLITRLLFRRLFLDLTRGISTQLGTTWSAKFCALSTMVHGQTKITMTSKNL